MLSEAIEKILALAKPNFKDVGPLTYSDKPMSCIKYPVPEPLFMQTLTGLVDFLRSADGTGVAIISIDSPVEVSLLSLLCNTQQRHIFAKATYEMPTFPFNSVRSIEEFIIGLQAKFVPTDELKDVLKIVGNLKDEAVKTLADDGVSQRVTVSTGMANVENKVLPNPVTLKPYRTFPDIDQPESQFVLRMSSGGGCALYEADGDQWKMEAIANIKAWLEEKVEAFTDQPTILA